MSNFFSVVRSLTLAVVVPSVAAIMAIASPNAYALPVVIADSPPLDINTVKPNIMFTLDTSGSMQLLYVPDRSGNVTGNNCFKNSISNPLYYDPAVTYDPPRSYNGTTNTNTVYLDSTYTAAWWDGFNTGAKYTENGTSNKTALINLSTNFRPDYEYSSGANANEPAGDGYYMAYTPIAPFVAAGALSPTAAMTVSGNPAVHERGRCHTDASYTRVNMSTQSAAQQTNFANWFSYYRSRMQAMKSAAGIAFSELDKDEFRVGFHNIWQTAGSFLNIADFRDVQRQTWYERFYASVPSGGTPSRQAAIRVGEYFKTGVMNGVTGSIDPIQKSCQANYHILSTDGYWNEGTPGYNPSAISQEDVTIPATILGVPAVTGLTPSAPWPLKFRQSAAALAGSEVNTVTMSDIATYYWANDLRPTGPVSANNVPAGEKDPANWQHVVLFGVSIAASGTLPYTNASGNVIASQTVAEIAAGTRVWPHPINNSPSAIDDLWHSTVNARGDFFNVNNPAQLATALSTALLDIAGRSTSAANVGLANANLTTSSNNIAFVPSYKPGSWIGDLIAKNVDANTGGATTNIWKHAEVLDAQALGTGWSTNRKLLTRAAGLTVPFRSATISPTQLASLGATVAERQAVLDYLRGDKTNEDAGVGYKLRPRTNLLGDIISSEPVAISAPIEVYQDNYNPGYAAFKTAKASRTPMVYFGANDGFFHAVNGTKVAPDMGKEVWSYMPSELFRTDGTGVVALSYKPTDPAPKKFAHKYYVDARPFYRDADFSRTTQNPTAPTPTGAFGATPDWRTVLITGMGKGGKSYIAFDVTNPPLQGDTEAGIASSGVVLWEFTDPDMGFTYGLPVITKTARFGWVAILASGYNNITGSNAGKGIAYVVDVKTGVLLHKFMTADGSAIDPIGMAYLNTFIPDARDFTSTEIYAGDLFGNIWRFDLTGTVPYSTSGVKVAQLKDAANKIQPITAYPFVYTDSVSGDRFVGVGTGKLLGLPDVTNVDPQTFYNLRDGTKFAPSVIATPIVRADLTSISQGSTTAVTTTAKGWYQDLTLNPGERIIKEIAVENNVAIYTSIAPSSDACDRGGIGTLYARSASTAANQISGATYIGGVVGSPPIAGVRVIKRTDGQNVVQILDGAGALTVLTNISFPSGFVGTIVNYREILE
jgi:type IV pilus assembly protein PilY1